MICPYCKKEIEPIEETTSTISIIKDKDGRLKIWTEETRDPDSILISKRVDEYTYFTPTGEIDTIIQKIYDGEGGLTPKKEVKHFKDGSQPIVTSPTNNK